MMDVYHYTYTHHQVNGNRYIEGQGTFPDIRLVEIDLPDYPQWVIGTTAGWLVMTQDGRLYQVDEQEAEVKPLNTTQQAPPIAAVNQDGNLITLDMPADLSPYTHPVYTQNHSLYIADNGDVVLLDAQGNEEKRLALKALPDGRIVLSGDGRAALFVEASDERYVHGIMGDDLEGWSLAILDENTLDILTRIDLENDDVFEGLAPIWADVNADGHLDLITTVSNAAGGAQIRVYAADNGMLLASGPAIGQGNRWRHQLAWGPFGTDGQSMLVEVLTPHIGGVIGFYEYDGDKTMHIVARKSGFTSHVIGSRNLDMAVAGDFNGDGQPEIVLPNQAMNWISGLQLDKDGTIRELWAVPLNAQLVTNIAAVKRADGRLALAAGLDNNQLRIWLS